MSEDSKMSNCHIKGKFLNNKFYHPSVCAHVQGYCNCEEQEGITHWMPLPDAPHE